MRDAHNNRDNRDNRISSALLLQVTILRVADLVLIKLNNMESCIKIQFKQFANPLLVINAICIIMATWFTYKHYFKNDGKGIEYIFYMLSIFILHSFFGLVALFKLDRTNTYKISLVIANIFI